MSSELVGHGRTLAGLWRAARDGRLAHALLFRGPAGIGKFRALRELALGLLCADGPGPPCRACGACKLALSGNHPDLLVVDVAAEGDEVLRVGRIVRREDARSTAPSIEEFLSLQAYEGGWRVVLVREAERMNESAQNAFLKTLEEPGRKALLALETAHPARLLATVRSRLVAVELAPLEPLAARAVLEAKGLERSVAEELARASRGAPGRALELGAQRAPEIRAQLVRLLLGERTAYATLAALTALEGEYPGGTPVARERGRARAVLDVGIELLGDLARLAAGADPARLAHGAELDAARAAGLRPRFGGPERSCLEEWLAARQDLEVNLAGETLLDRALHALADLGPDAGDRARASAIGSGRSGGGRR